MDDTTHEALKTGCEEAIRFIEWIELLAKDGVEIYKHELRGNAEMFRGRIESALAAANAAEAKPEPVAWFEAEERARGADLHSAIGGILYSTRFHTKKPETTNPVWPLYATLPATMDAQPISCRMEDGSLVIEIHDHPKRPVLVVDDGLQLMWRDGEENKSFSTVQPIDGAVDEREESQPYVILSARLNELAQHLADIRDMFPVPAGGTELESLWTSAAGSPDDVAPYVRAALSSNHAKSGAVDERHWQRADMANEAKRIAKASIGDELVVSVLCDLIDRLSSNQVNAAQPTDFPTFDEAMVRDGYNKPERHPTTGELLYGRDADRFAGWVAARHSAAQPEKEATVRLAIKKCIHATLFGDDLAASYERIEDAAEQIVSEIMGLDSAVDVMKVQASIDAAISKQSGK